jgi:cytochrome c oxidase subunit 6c
MYFRRTMSNPPPVHLMRNMLHTSARKFIWPALAFSVGGTITFYYGYCVPRRQRYEEFFSKYDPYVRMQEICSYDRKYLHSCPSELAKRWEEKGGTIAALEELKRNISNATAKAQDTVSDAASSASGKAKKLAGAAAQKAGEMTGVTSDKAGDWADAAQEKAGEWAGAAQEKANEWAGAAQEKAGELAEAASEKVEKLKKH